MNGASVAAGSNPAAFSAGFPDQNCAARLENHSGRALHSAAAPRPVMFTMRRSTLSWFLSLLLVLVQHGAVLHELSHLTHRDQTSGTTLHAESHALNSSLCTTCQAFAQIANPAAASAPVVAVCPAAVLPTPDPRYAIVGVDTPTPRSRGPPQV